LSLHHAAGDRSNEAAVLEGLGLTLTGLGRPGEAREALQAALAINRRLRERYAERDVLGRLAEVERDSRNLALAATYAEASATLDEELRAEITTPELRASFIAAEQDRYEQYVDILQRRQQADETGGHAARALEVSERARARVLLDTLASAHVDLREGIDPGLLAQERSLQQELTRASSQLSRVLATTAGGDAAKIAAQRVDQFTTELQQLRASIRRRNPRYASATLPQPLTIGEIQARVVDADTVLLEYMLGEERSWLWAVTTDGIVSVALPPRPAIESAVRLLYTDMSARQPVRGESDAGYTQRVRRADARLASTRGVVSQMLLGGIAERLDGQWRRKRLAIVATGALEYVPFAALFTPELPARAAGGSRRSAQGAQRVSLAARHEIVVIPSASVLDALRRDTAGRRPAPMAAAVLADPVFEQADPRLRRSLRAVGTGAPRHVLASKQMRGGAGPEPLLGANALDVTPALTRGTLARLPFSREEAAAIAALVPGGQVTLATDFKASRRTVLDGSLRGHRVVHFATHGVFDASSPALSGLVLSLVDERGNAQDGFVRLNDIYNMRLDADLVILSACRTALGEEIKGEGLVGLTRAFMYAGAPRVVASLWQVSDAATAELMERFYRALFVDRLRPAAALRSAQLDLSRDARWSAPYYWAGFVLQGEWR
jgi:CHAT domain-containing protein